MADQKPAPPPTVAAQAEQQRQERLDKERQEQARKDPNARSAMQHALRQPQEVVDEQKGDPGSTNPSKSEGQQHMPYGTTTNQGGSGDQRTVQQQQRDAAAGRLQQDAEPKEGEGYVAIRDNPNTGQVERRVFSNEEWEKRDKNAGWSRTNIRAGEKPQTPGEVHRVHNSPSGVPDPNLPPAPPTPYTNDPG